MKSQHKKPTGEFSENLIETLELPKDLILSMPVLSVTGDRELIVENHRGISYYSEQKMLIACCKQQLEITGNALMIEYYTKDSLKIRGRIVQIQFLS